LPRAIRGRILHRIIAPGMKTPRGPRVGTHRRPHPEIEGLEKMKKPFRPFVLLLVWVSLSVMPGGVHSAVSAEEPCPRISESIVTDSDMTEDEAFAGLAPKCPEEIRRRQKLVTVTYYAFDRRVHRGQVVVDAALEEDIQAVFEVALRERFPIHSVIPISDRRFRKDGRWDDDLSMAANNTSAFNYRKITGGKRLSRHALGRAIDINPLQNPYIKGSLVLPPGATYDPRAEGTLTEDHPVVREFLRRGWTWGGNWDVPKDYQHFEK